MIESEVRGVAVMTSSLDGEVAEELTPNQVGVVFCNLGPGRKFISSVEIDHPQGISQALGHVIELGHKNVAVIAGPQRNRTAVTIRDAIVQGLERCGLRPSAVLESDYRLKGLKKLNDSCVIPNWRFRLGEGPLVYINVYPTYDILRPDPRFLALVKRIGLSR